ncbi:MAG: DsbA family protein [Rhodospirillales bacterium]|nr:DsbA family protein [Rhodospirillales bacterium]MSP80879.1 DsbA family protein [Rhodospirillales bacterium]
MTRKIVFYTLLAFLAWAGPAAAAIASLQDALAERVLGRSDAPVTIVEYASLGCSHCASFHKDTLPRIKAEYLDTGRARLVFTDFPFGGPALAASMVARCAPKESFFGLIELFFREQEHWLRAREPIKEIERIARFGGMTEQDVQACLEFQPLLAGVRERAEAASRQHGINSTPTFLIEGTLIVGAQPYEAFRDAIEATLKKKAK